VEIFQALDKYGLLQYLSPEVHASIHGDKAFKEAFLRDLASMDMLAQVPEGTSLLNSATPAEIIQTDKRLISPFLAWFTAKGSRISLFSEIYRKTPSHSGIRSSRIFGYFYRPSTCLEWH